MEDTRILNSLLESISFIDETRLNNINTQKIIVLNNMDIEIIRFFKYFYIHYL